jgi:molybdenum cofactor biosynthesis enzyme
VYDASVSFIYAFEEATSDLALPPFSAQRAISAVGVRILLPGWTELPAEHRVKLAKEGAKGSLDLDAINQLCSRAPTRHIVLTSRERDPDPDDVPPELAQSLGPTQRIGVSSWRAIRSLDRYVLRRLASNPRLLARAYAEIFPHANPGVVSRPCAFGHCELRLSKDAATQLAAGTVLNGRAFVLARTAGVRAARRTHEIFDLQAERDTGPIELDYALTVNVSTGPMVLWQAHVSTWDGQFFPVASQLAATTAALAIQDMIRPLDPRTTIATAGVYETPWQVGSPDSLSEDATMHFRMK